MRRTAEQLRLRWFRGMLPGCGVPELRPRLLTEFPESVGDLLTARLCSLISPPGTRDVVAAMTRDRRCPPIAERRAGHPRRARNRKVGPPGGRGRQPAGHAGAPRDRHPGEAELAFAGLHQLVWPLRNLIGQLADAPAAVLHGVLGAAQDRPPGRFQVGAATLELLAAAAEEHPLLVLVDDAHWPDGPSAEAITFAARRLHDDPVALVRPSGTRRRPRSTSQGSPSCGCAAWTAGQPVPCSTAAGQ